MEWVNDSGSQILSGSSFWKPDFVGNSTFLLNEKSQLWRSLPPSAKLRVPWHFHPTPNWSRPLVGVPSDAVRRTLEKGAIHRTVVLKVLKASWVDNGHSQSLKRQSGSSGTTHHDNIVKVEQLTTLQGRPAVVMEYVRGLTLDTVIKKHGAIPVGVALQIMARVFGLGRCLQQGASWDGRAAWLCTATSSHPTSSFRSMAQ